MGTSASNDTGSPGSNALTLDRFPETPKQEAHLPLRSEKYREAVSPNQLIQRAIEKEVGTRT